MFIKKVYSYFTALLILNEASMKKSEEIAKQIKSNAKLTL